MCSANKYFGKSIKWIRTWLRSTTLNNSDQCREDTDLHHASQKVKFVMTNIRLGYQEDSDKYLQIAGY